MDFRLLGPASAVSLTYTLDEWLRATEIEESTRETYVRYFERKEPIKKLDMRILELLYRTSPLPRAVRP